MIKKFESFDTQWIEIMETFDVYQLYELLVFKYGEIFTETKKLIDEYEEDYNPDHLYDNIEYELKKHKKWQDFLNNYQQYSIEKDEKDPFHWRNRKKEMDKLTSDWDNL